MSSWDASVNETPSAVSKTVSLGGDSVGFVINDVE